MTSSFHGFTAIAGSTEVPLEMLSACHGRVEQQCATLLRLKAHLPVHGCDEQARVAAANIIRYFDTAAKDHHADEEEDLFPLLLATASRTDAPALTSLTNLINGLLADHRALEQLWAQVRSSLMLISAGTSSSLSPQEVDDLIALYERHIEKEENELLPTAKRVLSEQDLTKVGTAMRKRRGIGEV